MPLLSEQKEGATASGPHDAGEIGIVEKLEGAVAACQTIFNRIDQLLREERRLGHQAIELLDSALKCMEDHKRLLVALELVEPIFHRLRDRAAELERSGLDEVDDGRASHDGP